MLSFRRFVKKMDQSVGCYGHCDCQHWQWDLTVTSAVSRIRLTVYGWMALSLRRFPTASPTAFSSSIQATPLDSPEARVPNSIFNSVQETAHQTVENDDNLQNHERRAQRSRTAMKQLRKAYMASQPAITFMNDQSCGLGKPV